MIVWFPRRRTRLPAQARVVSNIREVRARATISSLLRKATGQSSPTQTASSCVPGMPLAAAAPAVNRALQIFACALAEAKGLDVDQPRNLAKSVTVGNHTVPNAANLGGG